jgi:predicted aldo/keto reductase-like oxidoreductase
MIEDRATAQKSYQWLVQSKEDASLCVACGACEQACPQHLSIISQLKEAHAYLNQNA